MKRALLLFMLLGVAHAGSVERVQQVRFSPDGARVMVASEIIHDARDIDEFYLRVLDTQTGRLLWQAHHEGAEGQRLPPDWLLKRSQGKLTALGIGDKASQARFNVLSRDLTPPLGIEGGVLAGQSTTYPVKLWTQPVVIKLSASNSQRPHCPKDLKVWLDEAELVPADFAVTAGNRLVTRQPSSAECTFGYGLKRVDVQGNRALFSIAAYSPGVEGPTVTLEFVAATLK
ncbi:DUF2259 domain-containing protein [Deinococcus lacus]|uniref:DUF2259 domain-containing protein n=1 Tax=Deinococcus lacus TaxID=392561 RepID=A0ABW1YF61_9DEIO